MIHLDNAATTRPTPAVVEAVQRALAEGWANPSSAHRPGLAARAIVEEARERLARYCGIAPDGVIFTSGGTEANHLAALGFPMRSKTSRIVASNAEHPSLGRALAARANVELVTAPLDASGVVDVGRLGELLDERVGLVALFHGHNEIGSRNPIAEIV